MEFADDTAFMITSASLADRLLLRIQQRAVGFGLGELVQTRWTALINLTQDKSMVLQR